MEQLGGLNDATRNQEFTMGSSPSDYTFGGILGTQEINTRASIYRPGGRVSFSGTNTNYSWRAMGTQASGMSKSGWAYVISASRRWAKEGYFEGTDYSANSFFASIEKKLNEKQSLNFTAIYAQNSRGKSSPNSKEVNDLMGVKYNSYWGYQDGRKRNSRDKDVEEPIFILSHYWKITDKTNLNTNASYQFGSVGNSRIDYQGGNNPDPTYYKNLPSYYLNYHAYVNDVPVWQPNEAQAAIAKDYFLSHSQIDWTAMYQANQNSGNPGQSIYALYEDRTDDKMFNANSLLSSQLSNNIVLNAGVTFKKLKSHNFQNLLDLLGGQFFLDIDPFIQEIHHNLTLITRTDRLKWVTNMVTITTFSARTTKVLHNLNSLTLNSISTWHNLSRDQSMKEKVCIKTVSTQAILSGKAKARFLKTLVSKADLPTKSTVGII
ncbi:hypothetical protein [Flavobacterium sp. 3HN19-14]|uniref:hypothetical protein n=1 Tax=Flavobacterium sp. 3HN19-14 TaxID=3448133 RepID=UPI003EDF9A68